jgi:flagellum-specific ATP synthase
VGLNRALGIGQRCTIHGKHGPVLAEVVAVDGAGTRVLPFGTWTGVTIGDRVEISTGGENIRPDLSWIGRVLNALGQPIDGQGSLHEGPSPCPPRNTPPPAAASATASTPASGSSTSSPRSAAVSAWASSPAPASASPPCSP